MFIVFLIFIVCVWIIVKGIYDSVKGNNDKVAPDPIGESFHKHSFQPTKRIPFNIGYHPFEFLADTNSKQFALTCNGKNKLVDYIPFDSIVDVELLDDHSTNSQSVSDKIKELVQLKDQQLITENEFESKRAEILARI